MACSEQDKCLGMCDWTDCNSTDNCLDDDLVDFVQRRQRRHFCGSVQYNYN